MTSQVTFIGGGPPGESFFEGYVRFETAAGRTPRTEAELMALITNPSQLLTAAEEARDAAIAAKDGAESATAGLPAGANSPVALMEALNGQFRQATYATRAAILRANYAPPPEVTTNCVSFEVRDVATGDVLLSKARDTAVLPASTTKVMALLCAIEAIGVAQFKAGSITVPNDEDYYDGDGTGGLLQISDVFDLPEVAHAFMLPSNNAAGNLLALAAFPASQDPPAELVAAMNAKAAVLGMSDTNYVITFGDSIDGNTEITAEDSATLCAHIASGATPAAALVAEYWREGRETITISGPNARVVELNHTVDMLQSGDTADDARFTRVLGGKTGHSGSNSGYVHMLHVKSNWNQDLAVIVHKAETDIDRYRDYGAIMSTLDASYEWIDGIPVCSRRYKVRPNYSRLLQSASPEITGRWSRPSNATLIDGTYTLIDADEDTPRLTYNSFYQLLEGVYLEPERENFVHNSIAKGGVAGALTEINGDPDFDVGTGWTDNSTGDGSVTFGGTGAVLDPGTGNAYMDMSFTVKAGYHYVMVAPQGVLGNNIIYRLGTTLGGNELEDGFWTAGQGYNSNMFVPEADGTLYLRIQRELDGAATLPELEIRECGKLPTDWEWFGLFGVHFEIAAIGTVEGANALDVRFVGQPSADGFVYWNFGSPARANTGEKWALSCYNQRIAGSAANVEFRNRLIIQDRARVTISDVRSGLLSGVHLDTPSPRLLGNRSYTGARPQNALIEYVEFGWVAGVTEGDAFDITIRMANPQLERRSLSDGEVIDKDGRTSVIRTDPDDPDTWVRAADSYTLTDIEPGVYDLYILGADLRILGGTALSRQRVEVNASREMQVRWPDRVNNEGIIHSLHLFPVYQA